MPNSRKLGSSQTTCRHDRFGLVSVGREYAGRPRSGITSSEFAIRLYCDTCAAVHITRSMSDMSHCYGNAMAESFFATIKLEAFSEQICATRSEARMMIFDYIEVFYNRQRLHSSIAFTTPVSHAARMALTPLNWR